MNTRKLQTEQGQRPLGPRDIEIVSAENFEITQLVTRAQFVIGLELVSMAVPANTLQVPAGLTHDRNVARIPVPARSRPALRDLYSDSLPSIAGSALPARCGPHAAALQPASIAPVLFLAIFCPPPPTTLPSPACGIVLYRTGSGGSGMFCFGERSVLKTSVRLSPQYGQCIEITLLLVSVLERGRCWYKIRFWNEYQSCGNALPEKRRVDRYLKSNA